MDTENGADTVEGTSAVIGISFGNGNSSIAFPANDGKVEVIANQDGDRSIPSVIAYVGEDEYQGFQAKAQLIRNSENTVANFRDFIGKSYAEIDPTYSHGSAHPVEQDGVVGYKIVMSSEEDAQPEFISVAEIAKRHLARLKESAFDFLGKPVTGAVIAVPTDFSTSQRQELTSIAEAAGISVLQVIQEPVAALLAYDAANAGAFPEDRIVLVTDFGATRSDGAAVAVRGGMYTVLATAHNYELGGTALDQTLIDHFAKEFEKKHGIDPRTESVRSLAKLAAEAEVTKKTLSASNSATISIESLAGGFDFHSTINRLRYEMLARKALDNVALFVAELVKKAGLDVLDIDEVVLVGGSSHTPKIASRIESLFPETTKIASPATSPKALNPAELVARGAAVQASLVQEFEKSDIVESMQPVVANAPHLSKPVGVVLGGGSFATILEGYTAVPIRRSRTFTAPKEGGDIVVEIWEGESEIVTSKVERPKENGDAHEDDEEGNFDDDDDFEDDEDDEERKKVVKAGTKMADVALKGVKAGAQIEVIINITAELNVIVAVRELGGQVARGEIEGSEIAK
ncbi:heat shock protein 70 family [Lipomyces tetrasporus]|uniref:Heat shock protein 70 family n=1 Tax=Lipomyces tetrasporus TaxID=54092 RepID=A0AAD7QTR2_9ASCO|nr:heat shock protein 70 family [Lipomyces tetrasporus]KAJ8101353.1 heat shock protein 70 family [Lipomyces tetrasporus]